MVGVVVELGEIEPGWAELVGAKAANLGALHRIEGVRVPPGFCVTAAGFQQVLAGEPQLAQRIERLAALTPGDGEAITAHSAAIRAHLESVTIPVDLAAGITAALARLGHTVPCAVRSSATAEDLPTMSAAGQLDTYLNVTGPTAVLAHVQRCWASLFTERAVRYRLHHGVDQRAVGVAVIVQRLVVAQAAGVLFTADPVSSNRAVVAIEAAFGLGEAVVGGLVDADRFVVRGGRVLARTVAAKELAVEPAPAGGTRRVPLDAADRYRPALGDDQAVALAQLGRRIEAHLGAPQDIEWCLAEDGFHILQSRPITTLFPVPATADDATHVYVSVGHQQMMTDALTPLGLSLWKMIAMRPLHDAGGRLFVDVAAQLAVPAARDALVAAFGSADPLTAEALRAVVARDDLMAALPAPPDPPAPPGPPPGAPAGPPPIDDDAALVDELIERTEASIAALRCNLDGAVGPALLDVLRADTDQVKRLIADPQSMAAILGAMAASAWLNDQLLAWLGERNAADVLTRSVPGNVTSEMGLALLDVADAIRPYPQAVAVLAEPGGEDLLGRLAAVPGGTAAVEAIDGFLERYGMRGVGEIDIGRPRWAEQPSTLAAPLLGNVRTFAAGEGRRRFERGRREALAKQADLVERLRALPDGDAKAAETERMIARVRALAGYREFPKYGIVRRLFLYKQALLAEAGRLVDAGALDEPDDLFFLTFEEVGAAVRSGSADRALIARRRRELLAQQALTPPRVMTSDGEVIAAAYRRDDVPNGALPGLGVSAGVVEGRARVISDVAGAELAPGDILVTRFTDPSWSPLFVAATALVTEVGGLMTHGAVIAREYGLPAVVGVQGATRLIDDGRRIRVNGTEGYVELLP
ncbi:MAG: rifamycin-inactivating phosphotransferase [Acidimicrobiia bacterium]